MHGARSARAGRRSPGAATSTTKRRRCCQHARSCSIAAAGSPRVASSTTMRSAPCHGRGDLGAGGHDQAAPKPVRAGERRRVAFVRHDRRPRRGGRRGRVDARRLRAPAPPPDRRTAVPRRARAANRRAPRPDLGASLRSTRRRSASVRCTRRVSRGGHAGTNVLFGARESAALDRDPALAGELGEMRQHAAPSRLVQLA